MKECTNTTAKERPNMIVEQSADCADCAQGQCFVEHETVHAQGALHGCTGPAHVGQKVWVIARYSSMLLLLRLLLLLPPQVAMCRMGSQSTQHTCHNCIVLVWRLMVLYSLTSSTGFDRQ